MFWGLNAHLGHPKLLHTAPEPWMSMESTFVQTMSKAGGQWRVFLPSTHHEIPAGISLSPQGGELAGVTAKEGQKC